MCLTINKKLHSRNKPLIAEKDIYVIKQFNNNYTISNQSLFLFSPFFKHPYEYKSTETSSFSFGKFYLSGKVNTLVQKGLHSFTKSSVYNWVDFIVGIGKISKGSKYFLSVDNMSIVSNNLQIIDIIYIPNIFNNNQLTRFLKDDWNFTNSKNSESKLKDLSNYINKNYKNKLNAGLSINSLSILNIETIF